MVRVFPRTPFDDEEDEEEDVIDPENVEAPDLTEEEAREILNEVAKEPEYTLDRCLEPGLDE